MNSTICLKPVGPVFTFTVTTTQFPSTAPVLPYAANAEQANWVSLAVAGTSGALVSIKNTATSFSLVAPVSRASFDGVYVPPGQYPVVYPAGNGATWINAILPAGASGTVTLYAQLLTNQ